MLRFVPVVFDAYRPLKPHLRWSLQCLVSFADRAGRCFPSIRKLAEVTALGKSTVARHLSELVKADAITRRRRPGGGYSYQIEARFLPVARVSHQRKWAVPRAVDKEEKPFKKRPDSALLDDLPSAAPWKQRLQGWEKSGFWLAQWGPKPNEPGCFPLVM